MNCMKKIQILTALLLLAASSSFAQIQSCGTDEYTEELRKSNPQYALAEQAYLNELTEIAQNPEQSVNKKQTKYVIPVVFHIVHQYGDENISRACENLPL